MKMKVKGLLNTNVNTIKYSMFYELRENFHDTFYRYIYLRIHDYMRQLRLLQVSTFYNEFKYKMKIIQNDFIFNEYIM